MNGREERLKISKTLREELDASPYRLRINTLNSCLDKIEDDGEEFAKRRSQRGRSGRDVGGILGLSEEELPDFEEPGSEELEAGVKTGIAYVLDKVRDRTDPFFIVASYKDNVEQNIEHFHNIINGTEEIGGQELWSGYCKAEWEGNPGELSACIAGFEWATPKVNQCLLDIGVKPLKGDSSESLFGLL